MYYLADIYPLLSAADNEIQLITERYNSIINTLPKKTLLYTKLYYNILRINAQYSLHKNPIIYCKQINNLCERAAGFISFEEKRLSEIDAYQQSKPAINLICEYKRSIKEVYGRIIKLLWHVSPEGDIHILRPSIKRLNIYKNECLNAVFSTSGYFDILLYIGRAAAGEMIELRHNVCIYNSDPFIRSDIPNFIGIKNPVYLYSTDISTFEPVVDIEVSFSGQLVIASLKFSHEWVSTKSVSCKDVIRIHTIPQLLAEKYSFFVSDGVIGQDILFEMSKKAADKDDLTEILSGNGFREHLKIINLLS